MRVRARCLGLSPDAPPELGERLVALDPWRPAGTLLAGDARATVVAWDVGGVPAVVKAYRTPRWLFWRHPPGVPSTGRREWRALRAMAARGVPSVAPLAAAEWRLAGCAVASAVVTRRLSGARTVVEVLNARAADPHPGPDGRYRRALADAIGALVARCHRAGVQHRRLSLKNILVLDPTAPEPALVLVDVPWARLHGTDAAPTDLRGTRAALDDLLHLDSRSWSFFSRAERLRCVRAHADGTRSHRRALVRSFYAALGGDLAARRYERRPGQRRPRSPWRLIPPRAVHRWRAAWAPRFGWVAPPAMPQRLTLDLAGATPHDAVRGTTADHVLADLLHACGPHCTAVRVVGGDEEWAELLLARARGAGIPNVARGRFLDHGGPWREVCVAAADGSVRCCPATPVAAAYGSLVTTAMRDLWNGAAVAAARRDGPPCARRAADAVGGGLAPDGRGHRSAS